MEYTLSGAIAGSVDYYYSMFGATIGTLHFDLYNGSSWSSKWSLAGDQTDNWFATTVSWTEIDTEKIRFRGIRGTSFTGDISLDNIQVNENAASTSTGDRTSLAFDVTGISDVDSSDITWSETVPTSTSIVVGTEINTSTSTPPGSFNTVTSGSTIGGISADDDLSTKYLWVNIAFQSDSDSGGAIPLVDWLTIGIIIIYTSSYSSTQCIFHKCLIPRSITI